MTWLKNYIDLLLIVTKAKLLRIVCAPAAFVFNILFDEKSPFIASEHLMYKIAILSEAMYSYCIWLNSLQNG